MALLLPSTINDRINQTLSQWDQKNLQDIRSIIGDTCLYLSRYATEQTVKTLADELPKVAYSINNKMDLYTILTFCSHAMANTLSGLEVTQMQQMVRLVKINQTTSTAPSFNQPSQPAHVSYDHGKYQKMYSTYSGTDMVASITVPGKEPRIFGELSSLSYSIFRSKYPVMSLGRITPKGYTRGTRTITGILGFTMFDETVVYECMREIRDLGYKILMDEMPLFDVNLTFANEYGSKSRMTVHGITTYTEGMVLSVDEVVTQNVYEFYALDLTPFERIKE